MDEEKHQQHSDQQPSPETKSGYQTGDRGNVIKGVFHDCFFGSYAANIITSIAFLLLTPLVGNGMNGAKGALIGGIVGFLILSFVIVVTIIRRIDGSKNNAIEHLSSPRNINITVKDEETHSRVTALEAMLKAEAEKRDAAEKATAEQLKKFAPRTFTKEQIELAHERLGNLGEVHFILKVFNNPDSTRFAEILDSLLTGSGWKRAGYATGLSMSFQSKEGELPKSKLPVGVGIEINDLKFKEPAESLVAFLKECGMESNVVENLNPTFLIGGKGMHVLVGTQQ